jgi:hypothetical protein
MNQKTETIKLSASMIGGFLECKACFYRDYHHPQEFHLPGILNKMDRMEKDYYDCYRNKCPPILKGKIKEKLVNKEMVEKLRKGVIYFDEKLDAQFKGKMDDCFIDNKGNLVVMDNKTAAMKDNEFLIHYQLQLDSYAFLLKQAGYKVADYGYLVYYTPESGNPKDGIIFKVDVLRLKMNPQRALKVFHDAVRLLRKPSAPKGHEDCMTCKWIMEERG